MQFLYDSIRFKLFTSVKKQYAFQLNPKRIGYLDVTFCIKGRMVYQINGERVEIGAGDAIIFPPGSERSRERSETPVSYVSFNVWGPDDFMSERSGVVYGIADGRVRYLLDLFESEWGDASPHRVEKCTSIFFYLCSLIIESGCTEENENNNVKIIKGYIARHLTEDISLSDIAELSHFAPQYVCALFKKHTGMTLTDYRNRERIKRAKEMMLSTDRELLYIAENCGFASYNYFLRIFKKITGVTPKEYRKNSQII
jgi:AraC-like DNA-binding protein